MSIQHDAMPTVSSAGPNQTICPTATVLAGNTPAIGTGSWTLISGVATISTPTLNSSNVTAIAIGTNVLQWTISNGVCPSSSSTMSIQRDANPTPAVAGPNQTVCATTATLAGNTPAIGTGSWTLISGGAAITTPTFGGSGLTALVGGINVFQWTISNGVCPPSSSTVSVQRDLNPTTATVSASQTVCATTATISGATPTVGTGLWTLISGGAVITSANSPTTGLTALSGGVNVFQWTISNGVCPSSSATTSVQRDLPSTISNAGPNQTVCATTAVMAGNTPVFGVGTWSLLSGGAAITNSNLPNTGVTSLSVGINIFRWRIKNGVCPSSSSTVSVQRDDFPTISNAGPSQSVCGTAAILAANTPTVGTGLWSLVSGAGNVLSPIAPNSAVLSLGIGVDVFQWTISNGVCPSSTSTMAITAYTNPATSVAGPNQTICATATVLAGNTPSIGTGMWTLIAGTGVITSPTSPNSGVTGLGVGVNVFQWTISNGVCPPSSSTVSIQRDDNPTVANAGPSQTLCVDYTNLNATPLTVGTGSWTLIAGTGTINNPTSATSSYTGLTIGSNILQWTTSNGVCPSTSSTVDITGIANVAPVNAGPDVFFCGLTPTLSGLTPTVGTGTWVPVSAAPNVNSPNNPTTSINFGGYGTFTYIWYVGYAGCPNESDTVNVTLYDLPTPASVAADQTICASGSTISANTPTIGTGVWSVLAGSGAVTTPSANTSPVTGLSIGMNSFEWIISNGVCPPSTATINIQVDDNPSTPLAGADQTICVSSNATLNATIPAVGTGTWSVVTGPSSVTTPTNSNTTATSLNVGVNTYQWIVSNGVCPTKADSVNVFVDDLPSAALAGADQFTCSMTTFMSATIPAVGNGTWSPVGAAPQVNSPTLYNSPVTLPGQGVYSFVWTVGNGVCPTSTDVVTINTFANPSDPDAGADQVICAMNTTLSANTISVGTGSWIAVNPLSSVTNSLTNNTAAALPNQGVFGFVWQTSNSAYCPMKNDTVYVRTYSNPSAANAGLDINGNCFLNSLAAISPSIGVGNWSIVSGTGVFDDPSNPGAQFTSDADGTIKLVWTVTNGNCPSSSDTMDLVIDPLLIPQIITPNGDNDNDNFEIKAFTCLSGVKIDVFNRWGDLIYQSDDYKNDFHGLNTHGQKLVDDTYFYVLEVGKKTYKGYVVVKTN
jgi:gliding motility-associated-like protein